MYETVSHMVKIMSNSKWEHFHSFHNPLELDKPFSANPQDTNLATDWSRAAENSANKGNRQIFINGKPLSTYAERYKNFQTDEDVFVFFEEVILQDISSKTEKSEIVEFLKDKFHQGGLMFPVSAPFALALKEDNQDLDLELPFATIDSSGIEASINIQTTATGFQIQEITRIKSLLSNPISEKGKKMVKGHRKDDDQFKILPDSGKTYIVKLQGTLNIDFTNSLDPSIKVENSAISYGNNDIQKSIDKRDLGQIIADFFRYFFRCNKIQNLSDKFSGENMKKEFLADPDDENSMIDPNNENSEFKF